MIEALLEIFILFLFAVFILLPVYINVFKESLFNEWEDRLKIKEQIRKEIERGKKANNERKRK